MFDILIANLEIIRPYWQIISGLTIVALNILVSCHAVLNKRDSREALFWVAFILLAPILGMICYLVFGINRIARKGKEIRALRAKFYRNVLPSRSTVLDIQNVLSHGSHHLESLVRFNDRITPRELVGGNRVQVLKNGDEIIPAMLQAIDASQVSINICSYIFDFDAAGIQFLEALKKAHARGVKICVLIDDVGARYSRPTMISQLQKVKIPVAAFLPTSMPRMTYMNMRNHRKIMVVDGTVGFTGGMNIRAGNLLKTNPKDPVEDLHFKMEGPIVAHLQQTFAEDWAFTTRQVLEGEAWFPNLQPLPNGHIIARGVNDGPDEDYDQYRWTVYGGLQAAKKSIRILTPYFVPDQQLINGLAVCATKGVDVEIILPRKNNLLFVKWASASIWSQLLEYGVRIFLTEGPFDHSKLLMIDDAWVYLGSGNWDMRSFRLNFEFNVECFGPDLIQQLQPIITEKMHGASEVQLAALRRQSLPIKLRNGFAGLFYPIL